MSVCQGVPCALLGALTPIGPRGSRSTATSPAGQCHLPHPKTPHPHPSAGGASSPMQDRPSSQTSAASDLFPECQDHARHEGRAASC